ncbi:COG1470 family protein [Streptomyces parvus]|uniref:COG1470 family protein n=1 Tax=Streptomyces parvus TaxID=66428 RepID=UPI003317F817
MSPPTPRLCRALPVLTAALAVLLYGLAPPAAADDGPADWTARPAGTGTGRDARPYVYLEGTPGTVLQDRLAVTNSGPATLTVRLRGDGRAGGWIRFAEDTVTVPARTRADVPLALTVPPDAVPGDASGEAVAVGGGEEIRVPVRVRTVGPTLAALTVEDVEVSGGTIRYALVNRGNAMLRPRLAVRAEGVFGTLLDRPERPLPLELAPGRRVERTEPWPDAPALDAVTVRLRVTASGGVRDEAEASATYLPVGPVAGGGLLLLGGLAVFASGAYRRRRRTGRAAPHPPPVEARPPVATEPLLKAGAKT